MRPAPGVLALQGASEPHRAMFARLGFPAEEVRSPRDLAGRTHLVLPGGESTTLHRLLALFGLLEPIREAHARGTLALFGTCAGAILLSRDAGGHPPTLGLLDARSVRNAFGRQVDSFWREIRLERPEAPTFPGLFIRAPRLVDLGPEVRVLARDGEEPVGVESGGLLATTFHPELTLDPWFHRHFLTMEPG